MAYGIDNVVYTVHSLCLKSEARLTNDDYEQWNKPNGCGCYDDAYQQVIVHAVDHVIGFQRTFLW